MTGQPSEISTSTAACRLNKDQMRRLEAKAAEKGLPKSMMIKYIILEYLDKDITHENLLQAQMVKVMEKVEKNSLQIEFFQQMFYSWLVTWFASHPKQEDPTNRIFNNAVLRRDAFAKNFSEDVFNNATELFETLFANNREDKEDDE